MFQEERQNLKRAFLDLDFDTLFTQLARGQIGFKESEADEPRRWKWLWHTHAFTGVA
jgi:hypothetical protein